jgi:hypothetical protein
MTSERDAFPGLTLNILEGTTAGKTERNRRTALSKQLTRTEAGIDNIIKPACGVFLKPVKQQTFSILQLITRRTVYFMVHSELAV